MSEQTWQPTACILCECNCGIEVRLHADGAGFERVRGDKAHPTSQGYTCEKALRLDHYQRGTRLLKPLRKRPDGTFEEIEWDVAIREVATRFAKVRDTFGGETIFYYGGGGQGNHLGGAYSGATLRALGARFKANALSQEKTGEFWVNGQMFGGGVRSDFEHCEVAVFVGKNPWQSHGIARARTVLKEIANDERRSMVVIDPRRSETAELADFHLQVRPGTDAFCLSAMVAIIIQEQLLDQAFVDSNVTGFNEIVAEFEQIDVGEYASRCGVPEDLLRAASRRIAGAESVAVFEDLGIQMNRHSTMNSWLEKLLWVLTGNFARQGTQYVPSAVVSLIRGDGAKASAAVSPVVGAKIISGLVPCNVIPDEILCDHPQRYRAMLVESGNPAHSLADSKRMRQALDALELLVVIDVSMTETARMADYVLPRRASTEKYEATFFNFDFPAQRVSPSPSGCAGTGRSIARARDSRPARGGARGIAGRKARAVTRSRPREPQRICNCVLDRNRQRSHAGGTRAGGALPHARPNVAPRSSRRGGAVGSRASVRPWLRTVASTCRVRGRGVGAGRGAIRRHPHQPPWCGVQRG